MQGCKNAVRATAPAQPLSALSLLPESLASGTIDIHFDRSDELCVLTVPIVMVDSQDVHGAFGGWKTLKGLQSSELRSD